MNFKVGDKVICKEPAPGLELNKEYEVESKVTAQEGEMIRVIGVPHDYYAYRFEKDATSVLVSSARDMWRSDSAISNHINRPVIIARSAEHKKSTQQDVVNHPKHYTSHPANIECIQVTEHMNFCIGNAVKYLWRSDLKNGVEDLHKAIWYINREIELRNKINKPDTNGL